MFMQIPLAILYIAKEVDRKLVTHAKSNSSMQLLNGYTGCVSSECIFALELF